MKSNWKVDTEVDGLSLYRATNAILLFYIGEPPMLSVLIPT